MIFFVWAAIAITAVGVGVALQQANKMAKSMSQKPPEYDSVKVPVAEDGREIPVIFGTVDLFGPNVTWYNKIDFKPIKSKGGKK